MGGAGEPEAEQLTVEQWIARAAVRCGLSLRDALDLSLDQLSLLEEGAVAVEERRLRSLSAIIALATSAGMGSEKAADELKKL